MILRVQVLSNDTGKAIIQNDFQLHQGTGYLDGMAGCCDPIVSLSERFMLSKIDIIPRINPYPPTTPD